MEKNKLIIRRPLIGVEAGNEKSMFFWGKKGGVGMDLIARRKGGVIIPYDLIKEGWVLGWDETLAWFNLWGVGIWGDISVENFYINWSGSKIVGNEVWREIERFRLHRT
jgi:hypothetical protein